MSRAMISGSVAEELRQRLGLGARVDEQERPPGVDARRQQRPVGLVEARLAIGARRGAQRAVEVVRPGVVVALDRLARAAALRQHGAAVAADVQERAQLAGTVAHDEDRDAAGVGRQERAGLGDLVGAAPVLPGAREDQAPLAAQQLLVGVPAERQGQRVGGGHGRDGTAGTSSRLTSPWRLRRAPGRAE